MLIVTPIYTLLITLICLVLWFRVAALRSATGISIGHGGNEQLLLRVRQHGNCFEWMTIALLLMIVAEGVGSPSKYLHVSGILLTIGRLAHPFGLKVTDASHPLRYVGNTASLLSAITAAICILMNLGKAL